MGLEFSNTVFYWICNCGNFITSNYLCGFALSFGEKINCTTVERSRVIVLKILYN